MPRLTATEVRNRTHPDDGLEALRATSADRAQRYRPTDLGTVEVADLLVR